MIKTFQLSQTKQKNFALIGAAGYVADRHMQAIKQTNNILLSAFDPYDNVGKLDAFFPETDFFTEFERFDRHIDKLRRKGNKIDFFSICSPNYLHDSHIRFGLRNQADVICEKPLVLNPWNLEAIREIEKETNQKVYTILQLRHHSDIQLLKKKVDDSPKEKIFDIDLTYITARGKWYYTSWKGDESKSGGIATNIGIHFFDMLSWIFGNVLSNEVHLKTHDRAAGYLEFEKARVRWFLSINEATLPEQTRQAGRRTYRSINIEGEELEFSDKFENLHTKSYEAILSGCGFGIDEAARSIDIVYKIRNQSIKTQSSCKHPYTSLELDNHPFSSKL